MLVTKQKVWGGLWLKRVHVWLFACRVIKALVTLILLYLTVIIIGLFPVNTSFIETPDGIKIYITSDSIHADFVLPIKNHVIDWRKEFPSQDFKGNTQEASHVVIGWGNKGFYLETPTWGDLKFSTAMQAIFIPSRGCMHVSMSGEPRFSKQIISVRLSESQYHKLVKEIKKSFLLNQDGQLCNIHNSGYHEYDTFYEAHGYYHAFNTCNSWVGKVMREGGMMTPAMTPFPRTMFLYLKGSE